MAERQIPDTTQRLVVAPDATLCISVAARPGRTGTTIHNAAYEVLGLNFLYKAFGTNDIIGTIAGVRALGIRGCSVSMPFKQDVIPLLDELDHSAQIVGAVNTIVNDNGQLTGYNTDAAGVIGAMGSNHKPGRVLLLGAGGMARATIHALQELGFQDITIAARRMDQAEALAEKWTCDVVEWAQRDDFPANVLVNTTPVGMKPDVDQMPVSESRLGGLSLVVDVVASPPQTRLINLAQGRGIPTVDGITIGLYQAAEQFRLYTGQPAPIEVMQAALQNLIASS